MAKTVKIDWVDSSPTTNVDHIEIWRSVSDGAFAQLTGATAITLGTETFTDDNAGAGFADGIDLDYEVRAYNNLGGDVLGVDYNMVTDNIVITSSGYKIVTSGSTDNDRLQHETGGEYVVLNPANDWEIEVKAKSLLATNASRILTYGSVNNYIKLSPAGDIEYKESTGGVICDWTSAQEDLGTTTTVGAFNDGLVHIYKFSWTVGDTGVKLSIDGVDFGVSTTTTAAPTDIFTPFNWGAQSTREPWEFHWLKLTVDGTLYDYKMNEGSGTVTEYEGGTDHTINLNTDNATGQEARMWQAL